MLRLKLIYSLFNTQGNQSSFPGNKYFKDENFIIPHTSRGLLSMVSTGYCHAYSTFIYFTYLLIHYKGVDTNGSQFYISLNKNNQMNGRCVVFGRMVDGEETLKNIESTFTFKGVPARDIIVHSAGTLDR